MCCFGKLDSHTADRWATVVCFYSLTLPRIVGLTWISLRWMSRQTPMIDADHFYRTIISRVIESGGLYTTMLLVWVVYLVIPGYVSCFIRYAVVRLLKVFACRAAYTFS